MVTLRCPEGAWDYPISHGTRSFNPYRADVTSEDTREFGGPWLVDVPADIAHHFVGVLGFVKMEEAAMRSGPVPMVRVRKTEGPNHGAAGYEPDEDGTMAVPDDVAAILCESHGFGLVPEVGSEEVTPEATSEVAPEEAVPEAAARPRRLGGASVRAHRK
jgi:hypothetical protein